MRHTTARIDHEGPEERRGRVRERYVRYVPLGAAARGTDLGRTGPRSQKRSDPLRYARE